MKKRIVNIIIFTFILNLFIINSFLVINSYAATEPDYGVAPEIDGEIDTSESEWLNATKSNIRLKSSSSTDKGISTELWVLQNGSNLYISIQFSWDNHESQEFIGILISDSKAASNESFYDAKILQFYDLGTVLERYEFYDGYLFNGLYHKDSESNGDAAAKLDENEIIYEFRIPVNNSDDSRDVFLEFGDTYAFKIVYGVNPNYPDGFKKSEIVLIEIQHTKQAKPNIWIFVHNILCIIIFSGLGALFGIYFYKIIVVKKKIRRVRD